MVPKAEVCNAQDDDCNGLIDDGLVGCHTTEKCLEGSQKPCYTEPMGCVLETLAGGAKGFRCVGGCQRGRQRCVGGLWGLCEGAVSPSEERCDGVNNNCDGKVDEICACQVGEQRLCFLGPETKRSASARQAHNNAKTACGGHAMGPSLRVPKLAMAKTTTATGLSMTRRLVRLDRLARREAVSPNLQKNSARSPPQK